MVNSRAPRIADSLRTAALLAAAAISFAAIQGCKQSPPPAPSEPAAATTPAPSAPPNAMMAMKANPPGKRHIYSETADPRADIAAALKQAKAEHKRVLIDFGGDWCGDCQVLDIYFRQSPNADLLANNFVLAHVFINSDISNHLDIGKKYGIPLKKGVPALAVLDANGKLLYSQKSGEFEKMRSMNVQSVTDFLNQWKSS